MEWAEKKLREIYTKIASDFKGNSWYRNILMTTEGSE
jgi:hypothetical protein